MSELSQRLEKYEAVAASSVDGLKGLKRNTSRDEVARGSVETLSELYGLIGINLNLESQAHLVDYVVDICDQVNKTGAKTIHDLGEFGQSYLSEYYWELVFEHEVPMFMVVLVSMSFFEEDREDHFRELQEYSREEVSLVQFATLQSVFDLSDLTGARKSNGYRSTGIGEDKEAVE